MPLAAPRGRVEEVLRRRLLEHPIFHRGVRVECPCCGGRFRSMLAHRGRPGARCPRCGSLERHRWLWLYLHRHSDLLQGSRRVLHVAPEPVLERMFRSMPEIEYVAIDIRARPGWVQADLQALPFEDDSFDMALCNHVLEHVDDDLTAMRELRRVLRPGGVAVLQHPIDYARVTTLEDPSVKTPEARMAVFGQEDHARIYGRDHRDRLVRAGFDVTVVEPSDALEPGDMGRWALRIPPGSARGDDIHVCR